MGKSVKFDGDSMDMTLAHFASSVGIGIAESVAGDSALFVQARERNKFTC